MPENKADVIILAGLYHAIGRTDDFIDYNHGRKSVELLHGEGFFHVVSPLSDENKRLLFSIIEGHCGSIKEVVERYSISESLTPFWQCLRVLNDADALDRIRLSNRGRLFLYTNSAKQLVDFAESVFSQYLPKGETVYYHLTKKRCVSKIIKEGLLCPEGGFVFFARSVDDCLQLAPCAGGVWAVKGRIADLLKRCPNQEHDFFTVEMALLSVDLDGYAEKLWRRVNMRAEDYFASGVRRGVYEYLLPEPVSRERILNVKTVSISMEIPQGFKKVYNSVFEDY